MASGASKTLSVYLIAAGFRPPLPSPDSFARSYGDRLWVHICDKGAANVVPPLIAALAEARGDDVEALISGQKVDLLGADTTFVEPPRERASDIRRRLETAAPAVAVFVGLDVAPAFLYGLRESGARTLLIASPTGIDIRPHKRLVSRKMFQLFDRIAATNDEARMMLLKAGAPKSNIQVVGRLDDKSPALPADPDMQERVSGILAGRPLWLAAGLPTSEMRMVLDAQRQANGLSHRLLLVVSPQNPAEAEAIATAAELRGYSVARRSLGQDPEEHIQVYLADRPDELGLWYRLAPIAFMGGSLVAPGSDASPDHPAALGSAILYGPNVGAHRAEFDHLAAMGGARLVADGKALGAAVSGLLSPDKPAAMAHAAWLEMSKGAEGTDNVTELLMQAFDEPEEFEISPS